MRVLIIKLTSMGDLMHAFPALTDLVARYPDANIDWVVDESFAEVPQWHPAVQRVITTAHRRWKKNIVASWREREFQDFYRKLNADSYDVVIDLQSNLKSAFVSWLRKTPVHGYDRLTCREKPAHWAYASHFNVPLRQHAVDRQRELFAKVFGYPQPNSAADYGVDLSQYPLPTLAASSVPYVVFVHNASWPTKLWPVEHWQSLIQRVADKGYQVLLPCGSDKEYQRAQTIAADHSSAHALPKMCLNDMAAIMSNATAAVCSDTGLAHMAAVASAPAITLYAVTDTVLIGTMGHHQQHIVAKEGSLGACMEDISVNSVFERLQPLLNVI